MSITLHTLSPDECDKLLDHLQTQGGTETQKRHALRNYCMALLMLDTGLRVGELTKLLVTDLFYAGSPVGSLTVICEKKDRKTQRTIPLTIRCFNAISSMEYAWWRKPPADSNWFAFFRTDPYQPITTRQVERIIRTAAFVSIGRPIHPHVLRHTFATRLMRKCPIRVVQELMGHASINSTQIYQHPNNQDLQQAIDELNSSNSLKLEDKNESGASSSPTN